MSEKYKFRDPEGLYFVTCGTLDRPIHKKGIQTSTDRFIETLSNEERVNNPFMGIDAKSFAHDHKYQARSIGRDHARL